VLLYQSVKEVSSVHKLPTSPLVEWYHPTKGVVTDVIASIAGFVTAFTNSREAIADIASKADDAVLQAVEADLQEVWSGMTA
ncbi:hypothetical protein HDU81_007328, partial [Chytriomyces hyalinus]